MYDQMGICIPIAVVIFGLLNLKKKDYFWNFLLCAGLLPFITLLYVFIYYSFASDGNYFGGSTDLMGGLFMLWALPLSYWFVFASGIIFLLVSLLQKNKHKNKVGTLSSKETITLIVITILGLILTAILTPAAFIVMLLIAGYKLYKILSKNNDNYDNNV